MVKKQRKKEKQLGGGASLFANIGAALASLNNSKFFAGLVMIMMNIGSKYISIKLTKSQEKYLKNNVAKQMLIFAIAWMATKDILIALAITAIFHVLANHLLNEESSMCIIPQKWRNFEKLLDEDEDGKISQEEIDKAKETLRKARMKKVKVEALRNMNDFKMEV
jgi:hypothetical protein|uniref:EF-hand domain-containing protein n=1 Tax=viral metagenome TaxID=1070528 RepID=A0A6C0AM50_9ZZZZ